MLITFHIRYRFNLKFQFWELQCDSLRQSFGRDVANLLPGLSVKPLPLIADSKLSLPVKVAVKSSDSKDFALEINYILLKDITGPEFAKSSLSK